MRCIFCKKSSDESNSVEHVIPESLGNKTTILPKGAVCDSCNNYFASKVEKFVLDSDEFTQLRFNQLVKNKKGRVPKSKMFFGSQVVMATRNDKLSFSFDSEGFSKIENYLANSGSEIRIPMRGAPANDHYVSRFLAKMALEAFAFRCLKVDDWNNYIVDHEQLDPIRKFARYPKTKEVWTYSKRRIYDADYHKKEIDGVYYQIMNEWDILVTGDIDNSEFYFVIAVFGMEYAINLGGNSMDGYESWLNKHNKLSPLYYGKNAT